MQKNPHQLIEGIAIAALRGRRHLRLHLHPRRVLARSPTSSTAAVAEAYEAGYLGADILGTGAAVELVVHRGAGAYICGEETALLDSLEGKRGNPRLKPPFPAVQGLYGGPTLINNVETLSNVPHIVANGAEWFKRLRHRAVDRAPRWSRSPAASGARATTRSSSGSRRARSSTGSPAARPRGARSRHGSRAAPRRRS